MEQLACNLQELRKTAEFTQKHMSQLLHLTRQAYSHYEQNMREPDVATLRKMAQILDVSFDTLLNPKTTFSLRSNMEIERKFLLNQLPKDLEQYPSLKIEQGYLCTDPVIRIRRQNDNYYLTYKSKGLLSREEYNLPLERSSYEHLLTKVDGILLTKTRYLMPLDASHTIELDVFHGEYQGLCLAEVEFQTEEEALDFTPPDWFGEDVTYSSEYYNSTMSRKKI